MIWFNLKELENKLIKNQISEKDSFYYILAFFIIYNLVFFGDQEESFSNKWWSVLNLVVGIAITIYGLRKLFSINQLGDNTDFLKRLFSLAFVHSVRIVIFLTALIFFFFITDEILMATSEFRLTGLLPENLSLFLLENLTSILFYFLMIRSFKNIISSIENQPAEVSNTLDSPLRSE